MTNLTDLKLLSAEDVAELLGLSPWTVRKLVRNGCIQSVRLNLGKSGTVRFRYADVQAFIEEHVREMESK